MAYKTISVYLNNSAQNLPRSQLAAAIALDHGAHLVGVAAAGLPDTFYMPAMVAEPALELNAYMEYMRESAETLLAEFEAVADRAGVNAFERRIIEEEPATAVGLQARYSDLMIIGQTHSDPALRVEQPEFPQYIVLNSPHPVLVVPYIYKPQPFGRRVVVAWDGSMPATRAVTAALPVLKKADAVQVVVFNAQSRPHLHGEVPGADIALYLARHGVNADVSSQITDRHMDIGAALLNHVTDWNADALVMGCYGHSRFRELLLGGVSRTVLEAMTVPVMLSH